MMTFDAPQGPLIQLIIGFAVGGACGGLFAKMFRETVKTWLATEERDPNDFLKSPLRFPFVGTAMGACVFLAATLQTFTIPAKWAFLMSGSVTAGGAIAVWWQLGVILRQVQRGGVDAIDLGSFGGN
ncbi:MAG: hypothetical protein AAF889_02230 [Cyanobacteria bacterium P01_D01_bin.73]